MTHEDLMVAIGATLAKRDAAEGRKYDERRVWRYKSSVNRFINFRKGLAFDTRVDPSEIVYPYFGEGDYQFERLLGPFGDSLKAIPNLKNDASLKGVITHIRFAVSVFRDNATVQSIIRKGNFRAAFNAALVEKGFSVALLGRKTGVSTAKIYRWGRFPMIPEMTEKGLADFSLVEGTLGFANGQLLSLLPTPFVTKTVAYTRRRIMEEERGLWNKATRFYCMSSDCFPTQLRKEIDAFYAYKRRVGAWKIRRDGSCPSQEIAEAGFRGIFGFLALKFTKGNPMISGLGRDPKKFTLFDLLDEKTVKAYMRFRSVRCGGFTGIDTENEYSSTAKKLLALRRGEGLCKSFFLQTQVGKDGLEEPV